MDCSKRKFGNLSSRSLIACLATALLATPGFALDEGGLQVTDLTDPFLAPSDLVEMLIATVGDGNDIQIVPGSVQFSGDFRAAGAFIGGDGIIGFDTGIILSSGAAGDIVGPNLSPETTSQFFRPGDPALSALAGVQTFDAAILEFEFTVPEGADKVFFTYVFGSEEYNEYVSFPLTGVNDTFAFWVNGTNCATVPNPQDPENPFPVSITTINNGNFGAGISPINSHLFINNDPFWPDDTGQTVPVEDLLNTEMDGLTVVLVCEAAVVPGGNNTLRMGIADGGDGALDSWVLVQAGSLSINPPDPDPPSGEDSITVIKFYDANADGVWNPETEPVLEGWKMTLLPAEASTSPAEQLTDAEGIAFWESIDVEQGPFFVEEGVSTIGTWIQSSPTDADGNPVNPAEVGDTLHVEFGNYCLAGSNGRTLGFWSNPNGRRIVDASNGDYLDLLSGLNLRDARGERFQPTSSRDLARWLLGADATNMAYMLSVQAAAMALNLAHGFVDGNAHDVGYGASVSVLLGEANALLSADLCGEPCVTESDNPLRPDQEFVKDALDRLNSGGDLVPTMPCEFGFEED